MNLLLFSLVLLAVLGSAIYHISEKGISNKKITPLSFIAVSAVVVFICLFTINVFMENKLFDFSWTILAISICSAIIDVTIIYIYKQKGRLSLVVNVQNSLPPILLVFIGLLFFKESLTLLHIIGIISAITGITLIMEHDAAKTAKTARQHANVNKVIFFLIILVCCEVIYQISFKLASETTDTLTAISTIFFLNIFEYTIVLFLFKYHEKQTRNLKRKKKLKKILLEKQKEQLANTIVLTEAIKTENMVFEELEELEKISIPILLADLWDDIKIAVTSMYSYLFAVACLFIVLADYLLYKNGGDLSKVMNYIAPLETVVIAILGVILYKEKLSTKNIIGIVLALTGIALLGT